MLVIYINTYINIYIHTYIPKYIHTHINRCIHTYRHTCISAYMHTYTDQRSSAHTQAQAHTRRGTISCVCRRGIILAGSADMRLVASRVGRPKLLFASGPNRAICPAVASAKHEYVIFQNVSNEVPNCSSAYKPHATRLLVPSAKKPRTVKREAFIVRDWNIGQSRTMIMECFAA